MDDEEQSHSTAPSSMSNRRQDLETLNQTLHECNVLLLFIVFIGRVRISIYMPSFFPAWDLNGGQFLFGFFEWGFIEGPAEWDSGVSTKG